MNSSQDRNLILVLGIIIAVGPMSVDMYLPAFSAITREFGHSAAPFSLASYFVGFAIGQIFQGPFSDRVGRRWVLLMGLTIYILASIGCACAQGTASLCVFRALTAFGGAASIVVPRTMALDMYDGKTAAKFLSQVYMVLGVALVIAPALGGSVLKIASALGGPGLEFEPWRWIFVVMALYGIVCLVLLLRFLPETLPPARRLSIGIRPIILNYSAILRERAFLSHALIGVFAMCALFAYLTGSPGLFMSQYHYSSSVYAGILVVLGIAGIGFYRLNAYLVTSESLSRRFHRQGVHWVISFAISVLLAATACLVLLAWFPRSHALFVFLALLACGVGFSCLPPNANAGAISRHRAHAGSATALMSTMQYCGGAVAAWLVGLWAGATFMPMALVMFVSVLGALIAARFRPRDGGSVNSAKVE